MKTMKKLIFLVMISIAIIASSCSKDEIEIQEETIDYTIPANLVGTNWIYSLYYTPGIGADSIKVDYVLIFESEYFVDGWRKHGDEEMTKSWDGQYSISNDTISILSPTDGFDGTIYGESMNLKKQSTGTMFIFRKQ